MEIFTDIETVPSQRPDVMAEIRLDKQTALELALANIAPPGNYKKQETIDVWMLEEAPKIAKNLQDAFDSEVDAAYRKTGLDGAYGQICVIGLAINANDPRTLFSQQDWGNEKNLLQNFLQVLIENIPSNELFTTTVIGHNVSAFDLRFIAQRSIVHGIRPHPAIQRAAQAKPWESDKVYDTMIQWAGVANRISLDKLCKALSIKSPKNEITGATVWDHVKAGNIKGVADYCADDVIATRQAYLKMTYQD